MVKTFDRNRGIWLDENGEPTQPPDEAQNKQFDPEVSRWRFRSGHPNAGAFAKSPEPDIPNWNFTDPSGRHWDKENNQLVSEDTVEAFEREIRRNNPDIKEKSVKNRIRKRFEKAWVEPDTGNVIRQSRAVQRNKNIERAEIFKGWVEEAQQANVDLTYQDLQQKFKGIPTEDIRGKFQGIDKETGEVNYGEPSEEARQAKAEIVEEFNLALSSGLEFIISP